MIKIPTISVKYNWRKSFNNNGTYPVHIKVYFSGEQPRYYPVKLPGKVFEDEWDGTNNAWVKNTHPFYFEINNKIAEIINKLNELIRRYYSTNKPLSFYIIEKEFLFRGERNIFNDYFQNYINRPPDLVSLDDVTWEKYKACLLHLNNFQPKIPFAEIDEHLIARFKNYLSNLKGRQGKMNPATVKSYFDKLKVVLTYAAKKDNFLDPRILEGYFEDVKIAVPKKKEGQHLEIEEIQRLKNLVFTDIEKALRRDRDLFLFQIYTGFYYNDLQILQKDQLYNDIEQGHYIIGERDKNGNPNIIPLFKFPYSNEIINRYRDNNPETQLLFRKSVFIEVQAYNRNLIVLGKRATITRRISNKTARHTNAQMWIRFGAERPIISKMLGHEREQTTQNYYTVSLREVIDGTKGIDFAKFSI